MPSVIRTGFGPILLAVQTQLASTTGFGSNRILIARNGKAIPKFVSDQDIVLVPRVPQPLPEWVKGSGRFAGMRHRPLGVLLRSRLAMDPSGRDEAWLLDPTSGQFLFEEGVVDSLELFYPTDSNGNSLVTQGIRQLPGGEEIEVPPDPMLGASQLEFSILYLPILTQSQQ